MNTPATWRVQRDQYGNLRILSTSNLDHWWPNTVFESSEYTECLQYVKRAERRRWLIEQAGSVFIFLGGAGALIFSLYLFAGLFA